MPTNFNSIFFLTLYVFFLLVLFFLSTKLCFFLGFFSFFWRSIPFFSSTGIFGTTLRHRVYFCKRKLIILKVSMPLRSSSPNPTITGRLSSLVNKQLYFACAWSTVSCQKTSRILENLWSCLWPFYFIFCFWFI